ncbi:MAG TPA: DUF4010 domain-containing protein, partial [Rhizomicrobium sp.]|nr:DUF4010 domain-containing protein [Rhizomicrobium sp.]
MLRFSGLLVVIMLLSKLATARQIGLLTLGGLSGILDVDPITLSMAGLADKGIAARLAAETILVAAAANGIAKAVLAQFFGGWRLSAILGAAALAAIAAGGITWSVTT